MIAGMIATFCNPKKKYKKKENADADIQKKPLIKIAKLKKMEDQLKKEAAEFLAAKVLSEISIARDDK